MITGSALKATVEKDLSSFVLFKQGTTKMEVAMQKDIFQPEEMLGVMCRIDNSKCGTDISQIKIQIRRTIDCYDTNGHRLTKTAIVAKRKYDGVPHGKVMDKHLDILLQETNNDLRYIKKTKRNGSKAMMNEDITFQQFLQPSTKGTLMECVYSVEVFMKLQGAMFKTQVPPAVLPIGIIVPNIASAGMKPPSPQQWNPTVHHNMQFAIPEQSQTHVYAQKVHAHQPHQFN